jgi:hypothetical protein
MQTIDGRRYGTRTDLIAHSGYSRATLAALWKDRETNGHPVARLIDGVMHWDLEEWDRWRAEFQRARRDQDRTVDRSGDPDEELRPADQARLLGLDPSAITHYRKNPPPGWPKATRVEELPSGRVREYRTRRQLWQYHDTANRIGVAGRPAAAKPDSRLQEAAEALAAQPDRAAGEIAADLAARHSQSVHTWKRILTRARKQAEASGA